ncbi:hypothetical protein SAMN02745216_02087 [Desulfatibacillum alkenivorans DSM 16219]|uniref:Uroporphyrinogen decarboxylase (URO-D) n=1 Tax=Desulfatibacillum alkenivorans DSM 16219 TaxID=1121393 RepID=A0A1M6LBD2_9BACT|nr:hypothetical protein [Desulfatibacillum alkenivorans]SHJ68465.1 hypothetical protein SAMN02745216_02087 [Desulfatibacillum alkenivorans DSM 16219]
MPIPGNLRTTAMAVMPHTDANRALDLAWSLDVPFWPQLPRLSYYEDMYVQASEHFPGIVLDMENQLLSFSSEKFALELEEAMAHFEEPAYFDVSPQYSAVYHRFLEMDLSQKKAVRGQLEGPVSFGFNVKDENDRPIIFDDMVRPFMMEFMAKRVNVQLTRLQALNPNAFMFVDEPGLQFVFSALSGYDDMKAKKDLDQFFAMIDRPRGVHLCGNPSWDFLLGLDMDILSLDVYSNGNVFTSYHKAIKEFLEKGNTLVWGIVPTNVEPFEKEGISTLEEYLVSLWDELASRGVDRDMLFAQSLISPATCCLINPDGEVTVEKAFGVVRELSQRLRERFQLD